MIDVVTYSFEIKAIEVWENYISGGDIETKIRAVADKDQWDSITGWLEMNGYSTERIEFSETSTDTAWLEKYEEA